MCGIIGYIGGQQAIPILIDGLKKLEYRGYDSSGVGILTASHNKLVVVKTSGKIANLQQLIKNRPLPESTLGISHTRWATHGAPNRVNAHPHTGTRGKILVVHNGIIENYEKLREILKKKGYKFVSETDTEVIAHLIESYYIPKRNQFTKSKQYNPKRLGIILPSSNHNPEVRQYTNNLLEAVQKAIRQLEGAFAIGVICQDNPHMLVAARIGSPLIIGLGEGENFIASDVPAILEHTRRIIYLKDGQMAEIRRDAVNVMGFDGKYVKVKTDRVNFNIEAVQKQGFAHFMLKEIHEQPEVLKQMLSVRLKGDFVHLEGIGLTDKQLKNIRQIVIVACGTAYHAGLVGKYIIETLAAIPVSVDVSSEFRYRNPIIGKNTLVMAVSQSGETADTLAAIREAKNKGAKVISIVNVVGSSLARESDGILYTHAGPEIGVASTKAYTAQLSMLYLLAIKLGVNRRILSRRRLHRLVLDMKHIPSLYQKILNDQNSIAKIARNNSHFGCFLFLGRNNNYPTALEGALKLKEISYIPAEGYAAGEMKHGPIALIDEYRAVVCVATQAETYEKMVSNIQEIRSRKGKIIAIATEGDNHIKGHVHSVIYIPKTNAFFTPLLAVLPLQLIAYYISVKRGCDVDQPRNLAKSVTVE